METNNGNVTVGASATWSDLLDATRKNSLIYRFEVIYREKYTIKQVQAIANSLDSDSRQYRAALNVLVSAGLASELKQKFTSR